MRGGEKVLEALCNLFPDAVIFTHVADPTIVRRYFPNHEVRQTLVSRLPFARKLYKSYLPLMPIALEELDLNEFDLVISSEAGPAKGVIPSPTAPHICYCHSPMRYLWDKRHLYQNGANVFRKAAMSLALHPMRVWDTSSAARVDAFVANSSFVANRIRKYYRREAVVVHPPVDVAAFSEKVDSGDVSEDFASTVSGAYLLAGQLTKYKRADLAIEAFRQMGRPLTVIGEGEEQKKLQGLASSNVVFHGRVSDKEMRYAFQNCRALVFPGEEDFGIVPIEVMAAGRPVIAYGRGGALETVVDGETGVFFDQPTIANLIDAIERFEAVSANLDPDTIQRHARGFGPRQFAENFGAVVEKLT